MGAREEYEQCVETAFREFQNYDQIVDIVSGWEQFLSDLCGTDAYHFDRFPTHLGTGEGVASGPTFCSLLNEEYGLICEVQQEIPNERTTYGDRLQSLTSLEAAAIAPDGPTPNRVDVCLLIRTRGGQDARVHLDELVDTIETDSAIVPLEYSYVDQDTTPKYRFERMSLVGDNFRDDVLPEHSRMSPHLSESGPNGLGKIEIEASDFDRTKATGLLCNEEPPNLYLACQLWDRLFYDQLNDGQRIKWEREDPQKTLSFEIEVSELTEQLNSDYIPGGSVETSWVDETLEYLCVVEVATRLSDEEFRIDFRNLSEKRREYKDVSVRDGNYADLGMLFAEWHCENVVELDQAEVNELTEPDSEERVSETTDYTQGELGEF